MNPERVARLKAIIHSAIVLPADERPSYLAGACAGDAVLLREATGLLAHADSSLAIVEGGLPGLLAEAAGRTTARPERIGPYRILATLGEGGMGVVYHAEQTEPVRRGVALKLVRAGLDSAAARARFETERQTLAALEHPNIARVLDAGTDEAGRPWFAMELVRGEAITTYCRERRLSPRARVELLLEVCRAVRHAHRRGVLHRDLKPSNVLVAEVQGRALPKVIDFGIAKTLQAPPLETAFRTRTGQLVGTLEYMSPEQARGELAAVDVRSDVWALGVMLHELIADRLPIETAGLPLHEAVRRIVEDPPAALAGTKPSTGGRIDADLRTIVAKCLEKEQERRYQDASGLAEDLERYLSGRPILAHPPSATYQLRKLVGRHRVAFGTAAAAVGFLVLYGATVSWQLRAERRASRRAELEARKAARVTEFMQEMLAAASPEMRGRDATLRELLDDAAATTAAALEEEPEVRAEIETTLGRTYLSLQAFAEAEAHLLAALREREARLGADHREVAETRHELARLHVAAERWDEARREIERSLAAERARESPDPLVLARRLRTRSEVDLGQQRLDEALASIDEAVALHAAARSSERAERIEALRARYQLAMVIYIRGSWSEALEQASAIVEDATPALGADHPFTLEARRTVGYLTCYHLRYEEAEAILRDCLQAFRKRLGPRSPSVARTLKNLAEVYAALGRHDEAEAAMRGAVAIHLETNGERNPRTIRVRAMLALFMTDNGKPGEALDLARSTLAQARETLGEEHRFTGNAWQSLGMTLLDLGDPSAAEQALQRGFEITEATWGPRHPWALASRAQFVSARRRLGDLDGAAELLEPLLAWDPPSHQPYALSHAALLTTLGEVREQQGRPDEAASAFARAARNSDAAGVTGYAVDALLGRTRCLRAAGRSDDAAVAAREALERARAAGLEGLEERALTELALIGPDAAAGS